MLFLLAAILMMATAGLCWTKIDKALAVDEPLTALGYVALYGAVAAVTMLGV